MKKLSCASKAAAALLAAELLFFACTPFSGDSYGTPGSFGTLVIALPGDGTAGRAASRAAVSPAFAATLTYRVECAGPGGSVSEEARPGAAVSIPLDPGDWTVTVTALNAARQDIGSGTAAAAIESGKTTAVTVPVGIAVDGNDITRFALTGPVSADGAINAGSRDIRVSVPAGTSITAVNFDLTHTGVSVSPASGPLDFSSPRTFTVTAENGALKTWTVTVTADSAPPPPPPPPSNTAWPPNTLFQPYGLSGLTRPAGTTVIFAGTSSDGLMISLENPDTAAYNNLVTQVETLTGVIGTDSSMPGFMYMYNLSYTYSGSAFDLEIIYMNTGDPSSTILMLTSTDNSAGGSFAWPDASAWAPFGLSGLTQPPVTVVGEVIEQVSPYTSLSVTLNAVDDTAYNALYTQIRALLGNPDISEGGPGDLEREDVFMIPGIAGTTTVALVMDAVADEIGVYAAILSD